MKTKPIVIAVASVILLAGIFLIIRHKDTAKPGKDEISQFLNGFNNRVKEGNTDSLLAYFDASQNIKILHRLINLLAGKSSVNGIGKANFGLTLDVDASKIKITSSELIVANIPAKFSHDSLTDRQSVLILKIHRTAANQFKILQVDARKFLADYGAYEAYVKSKTLSDKDKYSPETLAAFKTATQLKSRYDSVIWFAHVDKKVFFYVVKGKWDLDKDISRYRNINRYKDSVIEPYKMGLVDPDLKEVIPVEYDLIHNISATFPGLVEVEKDNKRGFYDLNGKIVVPVNYDQVFPIEDDINLAVLRNGSDYFYLKKDMGISEKVDIKISDFFSKIKNIGNRFDLYTNALSVVTEYNSRKENGAVYIPPSYLTDLNMIEKMKDFKNPLRKGSDDDDNGDVHEKYEVGFSGTNKEAANWLEASFYSIRDYFLGGRTEFYDKKNIVIVDKKNDRVFTQDIQVDYTPGDGTAALEGICDVNSIKVINDSLFEVKAGATLSLDLYDTTKYVDGGPYYHYLAIKDNKLVELPDNRNFGFTKYVKMDDSYLNACYTMLVGTGFFDKREKKIIDHITPEMLRYMKNEIYADYRYQFKDKRWINVFEEMASYNMGDNKSNNANVDDSLTEIDKYNISWINSRLNKPKPNTLASK